MELQKAVGLRIRALRQDSGLTLDELGVRLNMKGHSIWRIETGRRSPSLELLDKLADVFEVSPSYFLSGDVVPISETFLPDQLDPDLRSLWTELSIRFRKRNPLTPEQAASVMEAVLQAINELDRDEPEAASPAAG
ncbi:MAG TPA: helix-turn-helix transcriptional regulator [Limnochordia bacterium]|nr:helix-turn-helix transcriptional regulator [Limnochordia bacterium]